ncbi:hypothetical protein Lal_00028326 [Lupinus albus]|nr:hypothetical protein Lal_00028326 [Lupinus albus]
MCLRFLIKCFLVGFSLKRENPAYFKNSDLTLSPRRGSSRSSDDPLAQARILQPRHASQLSLRRESFCIAQDFTLSVELFSPRRANSRSGETTLAQARLPSLKRESFSIAQDFTLPREPFSPRRESLAQARIPGLIL